ncbi:hypothetical protein [Kribbella italica]|uniref:Uncharacterized protein n=1 Tax=Kribbella italica TaxID=1540520 RepID=A0A7W9J995_9ACTN|nr:hypothetical protein [Kribbella italica]MBB5837740.1 hypothetical protein [Kribbella italica]
MSSDDDRATRDRFVWLTLLNIAIDDWSERGKDPTNSQRLSALEAISHIDSLASSLLDLRLMVEQELREADGPRTVIPLPDDDTPYDPRD